MRYKLDERSVMNQYQKKGGIVHTSGSRVALLPFKVKYKVDITSSFVGVIGEMSRLISGREFDESLTADSLMAAVVEKVNFHEPTDKETFKRIVQELFLRDNGELEPFHPEVFNYIHTPLKEHKAIASFLFSVLEFDDVEIKRQLIAQYAHNTNNALTDLIVDALPIKKGTQHIPEQYYRLEYVSKLFHKDLKFLLSNRRWFVQYFEMLLRYYYFFYVSQLALKLSQMFEADMEHTEGLYFTLDWESVPKSRTGYIQGWKKLEHRIPQLFSHVNCLEMMNHVENEVQQTLSYVELWNEIEQLSYDERQNLDRSLDNIYAWYINQLQGDVRWSDFEPYEKYTDSTQQRVYQLFRAIDFQFNDRNNSRRDAYNKYRRWFDDFCKQNFLKFRGQSGYTLNMKQEYLMLMTALSINSKEKLRLKSLFQELELRGLYFDWGSKERIIELFQKLNLLEKKSDSGDAQYVKSFL